MLVLLILIFTVHVTITELVSGEMLHFGGFLTIGNTVGPSEGAVWDGQDKNYKHNMRKP